MYGVIRLATPADAAAIARVHVDTWRAAYAGLLPAALLDALSVPAGASRWEGHLADPAVRAWVAAAGQDVLGFLSAGPPRDSDLPGSSGEVYALYVHPDAQRAGHGRALLEAATGWFAGSGRTSGALWTLSENTAGRRFYTKCGWVWDDTERSADIGGALVREVRYTRNLEPVRALS